MMSKGQPMKKHARHSEANSPAGPAGQAERIPLVDIYETEDGTTVLEAEVPGVEEESIDIRVEKGVLTVAAEMELGEFGEQYTRIYTGFGGGGSSMRYFRAFALSDEVDRGKIEAALADGVLTLRLPRAEAMDTRKIEIKSR